MQRSSANAPSRSSGGQLAAMPNFRDAGGHATTAGGRVLAGVLYRSDQIGKLSAEDARTLERIGIRVVYDLRTESERAALSREQIPGATHVVLDVLADDRESTPARLMRALGDPEALREMLGGGRGGALFLESYRSFVRLQSARAAFGRLYRSLADATRLPALVHCTTGKDRTGWACAALMLWLGVPYDAVLDDFLASNRFILPKYQGELDALAAAGGDPELLLPVLGVREEYLAAALAQVTLDFGSLDAYVSTGLGIDADTRHALRSRFLEANVAVQSV